jgi:hypothetical protein
MEPPFNPEAKYQEEFLQKIEDEIRAVIKNTPEEKREMAQEKMEKALSFLSLELSPEKTAILKLKLLQYFQTNNEIDTLLLNEAICETPNFLRGTLQNLLETCRKKTVKTTRENVRERMNMEGGKEYNPYIIEFETASGKYYLARLLNHPHLMEEGEKMNHCISAPTSASSYIYRMKAGDIDTFSFREKENDFPVATLEYDKKKRSLTQVKKNHEAKLSASDPFFFELAEALKKMQETVDDTGEKRTIASVHRETSEYINVAPNHICTERGEIPFTEYDPKKDTLVLAGNIETTNATSEGEINFISKIPSVTTNFTHLKPELKHAVTTWKGNVADNSTAIAYPNFESIDGFLEAKKAENFEAPRLRFVGGNLNTEKTNDFNAPNLEYVGGLLSAYQTKTFTAPCLRSVDGPLSAPNATVFEAPFLTKVKHIDLSKNISDKDIVIPKGTREKIQRQ